jgi:hypothetical protein
MLWLERVGVDRLRELVLDAWRMRAPAEFLDDLADSSGGPGPS